MKNLLLLLVYFTCCPAALAQNASDWLAGLPQARNYAQKRASSYDRSGGNADYRRIAPGETWCSWMKQAPERSPMSGPPCGREAARR